MIKHKPAKKKQTKKTPCSKQKDAKTLRPASTHSSGKDPQSSAPFMVPEENNNIRTTAIIIPASYHFVLGFFVRTNSFTRLTPP